MQSISESALTPLAPPPTYADDEVSALGLDELISLVIANEDRVPRNVIDACARHGDAMVERLRAVLADEHAWNLNGTRGEWWLLLHAVMILGLIPGERAGRLLVDWMRRLSVAGDEGPEDWLAGYWPALFHNKPIDVLPLMEALSADREIDWYMRAQAIDCVVALQRRECALERALDWVAAVAANENEDQHVRFSSGNLLLDFPRDRYRALLEDLARRQPKLGAYFSVENVAQEYGIGVDKPEWDRFADPWVFYSPGQIESRQQRWAEEDQRRAENEIEGPETWEHDLDIQMPYFRDTPKIGRNDPCPCGSGKKYKKCCLAREAG